MFANWKLKKTSTLFDQELKETLNTTGQTHWLYTTK